jgi:hypothetical protein
LLSVEADASVSQCQRVRHSLGVPPSLFPSDLALASHPEIGERSRLSVSGINRSHNLDIYLTYLRKRGPPSFLSQASRLFLGQSALSRTQA